MKLSFKICKIFGIPVYFHITFILFLPFFAYLISILYFSDYAHSYMWGCLLAIFLFIGVLVHEVSHSLVAIRYGIKVKSIILLPIGGISSLEFIPEDYKAELKISLAGPIASIAIGATLLAVFMVMDKEFLMYLGYLNLFLGFFNLVPAFPMDGGRVLRALLAHRYRYDIATHHAVRVGHALAILFGVVGIFINPFLILIAFFIWIGAGEEGKLVDISYALHSVKVVDIMNEPITLDIDESIVSALNIAMQHKHSIYPLIEDGDYAGSISIYELAKLVREHGDEPISSHREKISMIPEVDACAKAMDLLRAISSSEWQKAVILSNEKVLGIVTQNDIIKFVHIRKIKNNI